jgi:hypothetical protein
MGFSVSDALVTAQGLPFGLKVVVALTSGVLWLGSYVVVVALLFQKPVSAPYENTSPVSQARHLSTEQRAALVADLRAQGPGQHRFEFISASGCDECEEYAEELREAFSSVPGWTAGGGMGIFGSAAIRGIKLLVRSTEDKPDIAKKIGSALAAAKIIFEWSEDRNVPADGANVLIARRQRQ